MMFSMRLVTSRSSSRQVSLVASILRAWSMLSLAEVYSSWMNWVTARLQKASSEPGSSRMAFSQFMAAFSGMPRQKQASPRFLQKQFLRLNLRHFSSTTMDSEYRPSILSAAARLLCRCSVTSNSSALSSIFSRMLSHTYRHSFARPLYRYRYDRYSAAERFSGEYLRAAFRSSMAFSLPDFNAQLNRQRECVSLFSRTISSSSTLGIGLGMAMGMRLSVSSLSSSLTEGRGKSSCFCSTGLRVMPKPVAAVVCCCLSILRLFLKMGDCISSMCCLSAMGILTILLVTTSFSLRSLGTGGAGMMLLMSSAMLTPPFWKRLSKMFWSESLEETSERLSGGLLSFISLFLSAELPRGAVTLISTGSLFSLLGLSGLFSTLVCSVSEDLLSSLEEKTVSRICFFLSSSSFISFSPCCPNFMSLIPSSIDDLLLLSRFAFSSFVSLPIFSSGSGLVSRVTGMVEPALVALQLEDSFLPSMSLTTSLLGVELFSLALSSRVILFFMRELDFMTSSSFPASGFRSCVSFSLCLSWDWQRSLSLKMDSKVSLSLALRCVGGRESFSLRKGSLASSLSRPSAASTMEAVHSTSAKQVWSSSFLKVSGLEFLAKSLMALSSLALILRQSRLRMRWQVGRSPCLRRRGCVRRSVMRVCACSNHVVSAWRAWRRQSVARSWRALLLNLASAGGGECFEYVFEFVFVEEGGVGEVEVVLLDAVVAAGRLLVVAVLRDAELCYLLPVLAPAHLIICNNHATDHMLSSNTLNNHTVRFHLRWTKGGRIGSGADANLGILKEGQIGIYIILLNL